jgi:hypothetical protein
MPFSDYDSDALRVLSAALSGALDSVRKSKGRALTEPETSKLSKKLAANLMAAFDDGNREPGALRHAALEGEYVSLGTSMSDV